MNKKKIVKYEQAKDENGERKKNKTNNKQNRSKYDANITGKNKNQTIVQLKT